MNVQGLYISKKDVCDLFIHHDPKIISLIEITIKEGVKTPKWLDALLQGKS